MSENGLTFDGEPSYETPSDLPELPNPPRDGAAEMPGSRATYSPDDNKLRFYAPCRLTPTEYAEAKSCGFSWAPKQQLFVAPAWTPAREDLLLRWAGEIEDEDTSLVERAEERADRFEGYEEKRRDDAQAAHAAVERITDGIPLGQPILVGHHSERHARRDAERIENGMRKAIRAWDTANYWKSRAAGAIQAAKYKELPAVRSRRIKRLESELRKTRAEQEKAKKRLRFWTEIAPKLTRERLIEICGGMASDGEVTLADGAKSWSAYSALKDEKIEPAEVIRQRVESLPRFNARLERWAQHYEGRLEYERAMMEDATGVSHLSDRWPHLAVGARITCRHWQLDWRTDVVFVVSKVNIGANGKPSSVSVAASKAVVPVEAILSCEPPEEGVAEKVKAAEKLPPLCNYPSPGAVEVTAAEWKRLTRCTDSFGTYAIEGNETHGAHRRRGRWGRVEGGTRMGYGHTPYFLTDAKRTDPPPPTPKPEVPAEIRPKKVPAAAPEPPKAPTAPDPEAAKFEALRTQAAAGVAVVVAPQLFPTPPELAARMVAEANIEPGSVVLEPSAGTGNLVRAIREAAPAAVVHAVEINPSLAAQIRAAGILDETAGDSVVCADFLEIERPSPAPDRVVMNPPFSVASGGGPGTHPEGVGFSPTRRAAGGALRRWPPPEGRA
jgi:hypothetical protein